MDDLRCIPHILALLIVVFLITPVWAVTFVRINGAADTLITTGQSFEITADCAPGGEVTLCLAWDKNANKAYDHGIDRIVGPAALLVDNSSLDQDPTAGLLRAVDSLVDPGQLPGRRFVLVAVETASGTSAQCSGVLIVDPTLQGIRGRVSTWEDTPAVGVLVTATTTPASESEQFLAGSDIGRAETDSNGNYTIYLKRPGQYRVGIGTEPGILSPDGCERKVSVTAGTFAQGADFTQPAPQPDCQSVSGLFTLSGIVRDQADRPLPFVRAEAAGTQAYTNPQGAYEMRVAGGSVCAHLSRGLPPRRDLRSERHPQHDAQHEDASSSAAGGGRGHEQGNGPACAIGDCVVCPQRI